MKWGVNMKKVKLKKKRKFKFRLIAYAFIMFLGYELSFNVIMNLKLVDSNEEFIKALMVDSNYHLLYEKKASDIFTKLFSKIIDVNKPISILENTLHFTPNEENMTYVNNPQLEEVEKLQKNTEIIVDKKTILLSDITFENPTLENNIVTQEVIMKVPPENYYNYQTITYNVKQGEETIYEILWKALKGGD